MLHEEWLALVVTDLGRIAERLGHGGDTRLAEYIGGLVHDVTTWAEWTLETNPDRKLDILREAGF